MALRWLACLVLMVVGCNGPVGVFPGGRLGGDAAPLPADWSFAGDYGTAQLETNPAEPYSVNVAYTILDGGVYVNAGDTETQWVEHIQADPDVRLQIDDAVYALRAERVEDEEVIGRFAEAWISQSMFRRDPRELDGEPYIYRLVAR